MTPDKEKLTRPQFIVQMAVQFRLLDRRATSRQALDLAAQVYREMIEDLGVAFGAHGYEWTEHGAKQMAIEWAAEHFEVPA